MDVFAPPTPEVEFQEIKTMHIKTVGSNLLADLVSKSTTESSVTTVISSLSKSSEEEQKSVLEDATSADFSKISGADLVIDPSKTSIEKDDSRMEEPIEDRGTPDLSKKSLDLTKDYSKSSIDSKDTSRDFATNELSKDSTVDLTKDFSKASVESVKETSRSIEEKTFSEDHSSFDISKTLASDASEGITLSREFIEQERSISQVIKVSTSSSQETSFLTESKLFSDHEEKSIEKASNKSEPEKDFIGEMEKKIEQLKTEFKKEEEISKKAVVEEDEKQTKEAGISQTKYAKDDSKEDEQSLKKEAEDEVPDMKELNRRCSNLLEDISQGALIKIDSSHVTHGKINLYNT